MSFYPANIALVKKHHPYLLSLLEAADPLPLEVVIARSGVPTARWQGCFLHSRFDPQKEARALISREVPADVTVVLFFGFGLGYAPEVFINLNPGVPVVILEPDVGMLKAAFELRDFTPLLPHVQFFVNGDLVFLLQKLPLGALQLIKLRSVYGKDQEYYDLREKEIRTFLARKEVNMNTLNRFGRLWVRNLVKNLDRLCRMPGIDTLRGAFPRIPALVLASGPSLEEVQELLPRLRERCLIISVDTSLRACLRQGVEPDFIVVVDPQYWNSRHLDWASSGSFLISESSTHPRVFHSLRGQGFFASSFFPLGKFFESAVGKKGEIGAGGSVATTAWDFARLLGSSPLYVAGLDLGFPGKRTHFRGAFFEENFHNITRRTEPIESASYRYLMEAHPSFEPSNDLGMVLTDQRMSIYRGWFESQMILYPGIRTLNLSSRGLKIEGMPPGRIEDLLALPPVRESIEARKEEIRERLRAGDIRQNRERLKGALDTLLEDLRDLERRARNGLREAGEISVRLSRGLSISRELERLNSVDRGILERGSRFIAGFLLQPVIQEIIHNSREQDPRKIMENSEAIYRELRDSASFHYTVLSRGREEFLREG